MRHTHTHTRHTHTPPPPRHRHTHTQTHRESNEIDFEVAHCVAIYGSLVFACVVDMDTGDQEILHLNMIWSSDPEYPVRLPLAHPRISQHLKLLHPFLPLLRKCTRSTLSTDIFTVEGRRVVREMRTWAWCNIFFKAGSDKERTPNP